MVDFDKGSTLNANSVRVIVSHHMSSRLASFSARHAGGANRLFGPKHNETVVGSAERKPRVCATWGRVWCSAAIRPLGLMSRSGVDLIHELRSAAV